MTLSNFFTLMFASATSATVLLSGAPAPSRIVAVFETAAAEAACARNCEGGTQGPVTNTPSSTTLNQGQNQGQEQIQGQNTRQDTTVNTGAAAEANSGSSSTSGASGTGIGVGTGGNGGNGGNVQFRNNSFNYQPPSTPSSLGSGQWVEIPDAALVLFCLANGDVGAKYENAGVIRIPPDTRYTALGAQVLGIGGSFSSGKSTISQQGINAIQLGLSNNIINSAIVAQATGSNDVAYFATTARMEQSGIKGLQMQSFAQAIRVAKKAKDQLGCKPTVAVPTTPVVYLGTPDVPTTKKKKPSVPSVPSIPILY